MKGKNAVLKSIRAIYKDGQLRLLDRVELQENQHVRLDIVPERDDVRAILGDLLVPRVETDAAPDDIDEEALMAEVRKGFKGLLSASDIIIEERREGP